MAAKRTSREEQELNKIQEIELDLWQKAKKAEEDHRRIVKEREELESTIPPLEEIETRRRIREHELATSRGEVKNILKEQNQSLAMLFLLTAATCALLWWAWTLMQGH